MPQYFSDETDIQIAKYLDAEDIKEKHEIFQQHIRPAFQKLVENLIYVYGFFNIDDVESMKDDCLTNLFEQLPKYKLSKIVSTSKRTGSSGFAYFNVIAKNWFFQKARELAKKNRLENEFQRNLEQESHNNELVVESYEDRIGDTDFWSDFSKSMNDWKPILTKKTEKKVLEAVIFLMKNPDLIPIYNKKAVYMYLREMTGLGAKQVVVNLKKIRILYLEWRKGYFSKKNEEEDYQ